jgi:hypothetical protein
MSASETHEPMSSARPSLTKKCCCMSQASVRQSLASRISSHRSRDSPRWLRECAGMSLDVPSGQLTWFNSAACPEGSLEGRALLDHPCPAAQDAVAHPVGPHACPTPATLFGVSPHPAPGTGCVSPARSHWPLASSTPTSEGSLARWSRPRGASHEAGSASTRRSAPWAAARALNAPIADQPLRMPVWGQEVQVEDELS